MGKGCSHMGILKRRRVDFGISLRFAPCVEFSSIPIFVTKFRLGIMT